MCDQLTHNRHNQPPRLRKFAPPPRVQNKGADALEECVLLAARGLRDVQYIVLPTGLKATNSWSMDASIRNAVQNARTASSSYGDGSHCTHVRRNSGSATVRSYCPLTQSFDGEVQLRQAIAAQVLAKTPLQRLLCVMKRATNASNPRELGVKGCVVAEELAANTLEHGNDALLVQTVHGDARSPPKGAHAA